MSPVPGLARIAPLLVLDLHFMRFARRHFPCRLCLDPINKNNPAFGVKLDARTPMPTAHYRQTIAN